MIDQVIEKVRTAAAESEFVRAVRSVRQDGGQRFALGELPLRALYRGEITQLESLGNSCDDWSRVLVADGFDWRKVRQCSFHGDVILGRFTRSVRLAAGLELPAGLLRATVANCVIASDVLVQDVKLLANYVVAEGAVLFDCGTIACGERTTFGNGIALPFGVESGGREVAVFAELDVEVASYVARTRSRPDFLKEYARAVADYTSDVTSQRGIIGTGAVICHAPHIRNTYIGPAARIDAATTIADSTMLSRAGEATCVESGACVTNSVLQWGSSVTTLAIVDRSVLTEHAHVERHGKVSASLLGPNTGVAKGELTSCLLGPFVGFQHQALLIATLWPEGKGNVSYGANVGSNHTSKAPDQEFWAGEGMFIGLGVSVKFPADFSRAPYTILASGITTLPQKVRFPFSLINTPSASYAGVSPAYNEIIPAWLLTDNLFALKRNESKYQARNKSRRQFDFRVFRSDTVDLMRDACRQLQAVRHVKEFYTDRDIEGLGKNVLSETNRKAAIEAYQFFIRYYASLALKAQVEAVLCSDSEYDLSWLLDAPGSNSEWEHARRILVDELEVSDVLAALMPLPGMLEKIAREVERSKAKDDERGPRIIDDYADVHVEAARDPFVLQTWEETRRLQREVEHTLVYLEARHNGWNDAQRPPVKVAGT